MPARRKKKKNLVKALKLTTEQPSEQKVEGPVVPRVGDQTEPTHRKTYALEKIIAAATIAGVVISATQLGYQVYQQPPATFTSPLSPQKVGEPLPSRAVGIPQPIDRHSMGRYQTPPQELPGVLEQDANGQWKIVLDSGNSESAFSGSSMFMLLGDQYIPGHFIETEDKDYYFVDYYLNYVGIAEGEQVLVPREPFATVKTSYAIEA